MSKYLAVLAALLAILAPAYSDGISGSVVDKNGKPVANVKLEVYVYSRETRAVHTETVVSDKSGKFTTKLTADPKSSDAGAKVVSDKYCSIGQRIDPQSASSVKLTAWPTKPLKGRVVDEKGVGIAGAKVVVRNCWERTGNSGFGFNGMPDKLKYISTGKNGSFTLTRLPNPNDFQDVRVTLEVSAPGRALVDRYIQKNEMSGVLKIKEPLECKLDGTLYLPGQSGVAPEGTNLTIILHSDAYGPEQRRASVGKDGTFHFAGLSAGQAYIVLGQQIKIAKIDNATSAPPTGRRMLATPDWALPAVKVVLSPGKPNTLDLVLTRGALIKGTVVDKDTGKPVANSQIGLVVNDPSRPEEAQWEGVSTDDKGMFDLRVAAGEVSVGVQRVDNQQHQVNFREDTMPSASLTALDGDQKTDLVFKVDLNQSYDNDTYQAAQKAVLPDFELKPGDYEMKWDPEVDCSNAIYGPSEYTGKQVDAIVKRLPKFVSKRAKRMAFPIDGPGKDGLLFVAIDESKGTGKGWDTAYIDANRNGDLTDDKPIHFSSKSRDWMQTNWVTAQSHQGPALGEQTHNPISVSLDITSMNGGLYVRPIRKGAWRGKLDSGKGMVDCLLMNCDCSGTYDGLTGDSKRQWDPRTPPPDAMIVDDNGAGRRLTTEMGPQVRASFQSMSDREQVLQPKGQPGRR